MTRWESQTFSNKERPETDLTNPGKNLPGNPARDVEIARPAPSPV